jgi:hypothetical protein
MARDIDKRLANLRSRRIGTDRLQRLTADAQLNVLAKSLQQESWQKRATDQPYTRYALGAMQEVDADYTRISLETAERVGSRLDEGLITIGMSVEFRLQGSVPLNVHIRGVSDVDLLILDTNFWTYWKAGPRSIAGLYGNPSPRTSVEVLSDLRREIMPILTRRYPAATVVTSGSKAIKISGGSLPRAVDVVPAHWYDTAEYQRTLLEHDRGVTILESKNHRTIDNLPFLHIKRISDRDGEVNGSLRKAIRLCKQIKADAEEDGNPVSLPSFDIAATMFHADLNALRWGNIFDLAVLAETQRHLDWLYHHRSEAEKLRVPDGSRGIFDSEAKFAGLTRLSVEMDDLLKEVAREQGKRVATVDAATSRGLVDNVYIPGH